jgi:hypothetical protein
LTSQLLLHFMFCVQGTNHQMFHAVRKKKKGAAPACGSFFIRKENRYASLSGAHIPHMKKKQ